MRRSFPVIEGALMSASRNRRLPFAILLLAIAAAMGLLVILDRSAPGGPLPTSTPPPPPRLRTPSRIVVQPNQRRSAVLISLGGVSGATLAGWMADGTMPALAHLGQQGWMTTTLRSVEPPLPAPALNALATGSAAGNDPIWKSAALEQRITALLFWPGIDPARDDTDLHLALTCEAPPPPGSRR